VQWANEWQLTVNVNKCSVLSISPVVHCPLYFINGIAVPRQNSHVDLGVTIDSKHSFEARINNIVPKARQCISTLFRGFVTRILYIMRQAFVTYIRPTFDYISVVWNPCLIYLSDLIENV
jgi:hypothetical protein